MDRFTARFDRYKHIYTPTISLYAVGSDRIRILVQFVPLSEPETLLNNFISPQQSVPLGINIGLLYYIPQDRPQIWDEAPKTQKQG